MNGFAALCGIVGAVAYIVFFIGGNRSGDDGQCVNQRAPK